ncbi:putative arginine-tRNA ligase, cytoplasmic [Exophiala dermatitidis]
MSTLSSDGLQAVLEGVGVHKPIPSFAGADIEATPGDIYVSCLAATLCELTGCAPTCAYDSIQWATDVGDLVVVLPRLRVPDADLKVLSDQLQFNFPETPLYDPPFADGINLRLFVHRFTLARLILPYIIDRGSAYGKHTADGLRDANSPDTGRKKVVVEFSSPNLGQEFDGNHLRSTIIGTYIASMYESMGWDVYRMNFLGDWGKNIGLLAAGWSRFGSEELFTADPLRHLLDIYTKIKELFTTEQQTAKVEGAEKQPTPISEERDAFFKKMEDGDPDAVALWRRFREVCVAKYAEVYARLHVDFDEYSGESAVRHETTVEVEKALKECGVEEDGDEAWIINFKGHGHKGLGTPIARHHDGTTSYLLRDIAAVLERSQKHSFDKMIYVVSAKQDSHFQLVIKALDLMGQADLAARLQHVNFGKSQGLSPKPGASGLLLGDILDQCQTAVLEFMQSHAEDFADVPPEDRPMVADGLGLAALLTEELLSKRSGSFVFDLSNMVQQDGYTGLSLQYWLERARSEVKGLDLDRSRLMSADYTIFEEDAYIPVIDVLRVLVQWPGIVKTSFRTLESSVILAYLFHLLDLLPAAWEVFDPSQQEQDDEDGENDEQVDGLGVTVDQTDSGSKKGESSSDAKPMQTWTNNLPAPSQGDGEENGSKLEGPVTNEYKNDADDSRDEAESATLDGQLQQEAGNLTLADSDHHAGAIGEAEQASMDENQGKDQDDDDNLEGTGKGKGKAKALEDADEDSSSSPTTNAEILKLAFFQCVGQVLENAMRIVGLVPVPA